MKRLKIIVLLIGLTIITAGLQAQSIPSGAIPNTIDRQVEFTYSGHTFKDNLVFNASDYYYYKRLSKKQLVPVYGDYITENSKHPYFVQLAQTLDKDAKEAGYTGQELVEYLVAFVQQSIPYTEDPENGGYDYPRYPIETIVDGKGDCEDKAALLVALLNTFGFDAILLSPPGHMAVGIWCEDCDEGTYEVNGKKYAYIEATVKGWPIGKVPPQFDTYDALDVYRPQ